MSHARRLSSATSLVAALLCAHVLIGCDLFRNESTIDGEVQEFVETESLPEAQQPTIVFESTEADVSAFRVNFGPGCDCPSGCIYSSAFGLKFRDRIGWMHVQQPFCLRDSVRVNEGFFDVQPRDSVLFSADLREQFRKEATQDEANDVQAPIYEVFLDVLAEDEDTPPATLLSLARRLRDSYRPGVGYALLENPAVRSSESILRVLADLPDSGGYQGIRDRARKLLDQLSDESA